MNPLLSIIIPAFNEEKLLPATLSGIRTAAARAWGNAVQWELIVCDNNSTDQTSQIAAAHGARVIFEPVNQIARARNTGAAIAAGQWFLFIDADSTPAAAVFQDLRRAMEDEKVIGGGALLKMDESYWSYGFLLGIWNLASRLGRVAAGSFLFCRADAFRTIGGFPSQLYAGEELEISRSLKSLGKRQSRKMVILTRNRVLTSSRKMKLYRKREIFAFVTRSVFSLGRSLHSRKHCSLWYDGRR